MRSPSSRARQPVGHGHELDVLAHGQVAVEHRVVGYERHPRAGALGLGLAMGSAPSTRTSPALGSSRPASVRTAVDLPLPFAPISATHCPGAIISEKSCSATSAPNERLTARRLQGRRVVHRSAAGQAIR